MKRILIAYSLFSFALAPLAVSAHELPLSFKAKEDQTSEQKRADRMACEDNVAEEVGEPHPLRETDRFEDRPRPSGTGVGVQAGPVGIGTATGAVGPASKRDSYNDRALADAEHMRRHNAYEIAMRACMKEKGYK